MRNSYHVPVLLHEVIHYLNIKPSGVYIDCTFGGGGHSKKILEHLNEEGRMIVFDQDADAKNNVPDDKRVTFVNQNFKHLKRFLKLFEIEKADGILADLGVSSHQIDVPERGFSTRHDAFLDMRMNRNESLTAADIIRDYSETKLHAIFEQFGEVTNSKTLARLIVQNRQTQKINTVEEFKKSLYTIVKGNPEKYFAQVFQALRIEVNDELGALKELLQQSAEVLRPGGRMVVISFHSLEDRLVKNYFKNGSFTGISETDLFGNREESPFRAITKKPVRPGDEELKRNPRSRSSILRAGEKV